MTFAHTVGEFGVVLMVGGSIPKETKVVSIAIYGDPMLGVVVGLTMVFQHIIAAMAGSFIPLYLKHIKQDPAVMTSMLMTTVTDVFGIAFLLGMGTWLLL